MNGSTAYLEIFKGIKIPADLAPIQKYVTLGSSDSGKTYLLAKIAEQCADAGIFFVILDPVGKHWSLRAGPDGKPKGGKADIWVLGGLHGDIPLDPASGELIADTVLDHPGRYVIDVSLFETDAEVHRFADAFARRLFRRKMRDPGWPMLLMIEEAESFLPQNVMKGQEKMKNAFGRIVRQGRNHGLGVFLVFQRSAAGDKGAISQCKILIAKRTSHNLDQDAIDNWVKANGTAAQRTEMMGALASMDVDEAYVWDPTWLKVFKRTKILKRTTFDSSANVKHGEKMPSVQLAPLDVGALGEAMKKIAEDAKANDPSELRKLLDLYERELESIAGHLHVPWLKEHWTPGSFESKVRILATRPEPETEIKQVQVPALNEGELESVEKSLVDLDRIREQLGLAVTEVSGTIGELGSTIEFAKTLRREAVAEIQQAATPIPSGIPPGPAARAAAAMAEQRRARSTPAPPPPAPPVVDDEDYMPTGLAREILEALASVWPKELTRSQLGAMTGKKSNSGYFANTLSKLRGTGYLEGITPTQKAFDLVGQPTPKTAAELREMYRSKLGGLPQEIFDFLAANPNGVTRQEIADFTGRSGSAGYFANMLSKVRRLGIVENVSGHNRLIPELYD